MGEADSIPEDGSAASAFRSLIADSRLLYDVVEPRRDGRSETRRIEKEGPTNIVTTSTKPLREQASTRVLIASIPDSPGQTEQVLEVIAREFMSPTILGEPQQWVDLQRWLALTGSTQVAVPYAGRLALAMPNGPVRLRRDFKSILTVVTSFALLHQAQRDRDEDGRILATPEDYELTRWLIGEYFISTVSDGVTPTVRETAEAVAKLHKQEGHITGARLAEHLSLARSSVDYRVKAALRGGWIVDARKAKSGPLQLGPGAPLPEVQPLPDLFGVGTASDLVSNVRTAGREPVPQGVPFDSNAGSKGRLIAEPTHRDEPDSNLLSNPDEPHGQAVDGLAIRTFGSEPGVSLPLPPERRKTDLGVIEWSAQTWATSVTPLWRSILDRAQAESDVRKQEFAIWMLSEVLRDPSFDEVAV